ncbi:dynamin family protein [Pseudomonas sp. URIL14HWK12:I3]|uniref:dynamin family protein n=1 Tax=unclassified Pseudomonas TaxID=196821 RepID=UPI000DAB8E8A|nr:MULTISPECIES: dynamin family protein [unclassified Pseudomonas]PZW51254.1 dynamin family protein [Pseudomonas sp. URIL14HWK12:I2]PZW51958.1 dynamin family protein [Pseudomonas sp. URIL14HWK12:I3]
MNHIRITHNPFTVETTFLINEQTPAAGCKLSSYKSSRLQVWVERLFDELSELFNGDNRFHVTFTGVEPDYLDIQEVARTAIDAGMQIELEWQATVPSEQRLEQIRALISEAHAHPKFDQFIRDNNEVRNSIEEAFNRDFDVYVVATMSSGKSTLINAMLGRDLLPAANEATTATIARITDNDQMSDRFSAQRYNRSNQLVGQEDDVDLVCLEQWNQLEDTKQINIEGNIVAIREREDVRLVLTDTPGPNNSQDEEHQRTTMGFIQDSKRNPLILYVLNASQLGTKDDKNLLGLVAENMRKGGKQSKDRFIFVINKMDVFDPEKGEDIPSVLARVNQYLTSNGIESPLIYPVSANLTRLIRKPGDLHTRRERNDFQAMADMFGAEPTMNMLQYMPVTSRVHRTLQEKRYSELLLSSGLPAVEAMIDEYIDKYNLPHRIKRAYEALRSAIQIGLNEAALIEQLEQDEHALRQLNEEIQGLQQRQEQGFDTAAYKDKLKREGKDLPAATEAQLSDLEAQIAPPIRELEKRFKQKDVTVSIAETRVLEAEETLQFHHRKLVNLYESVFTSSQEIITEDLRTDYQRYIESIFENSQSLKLPVLEGLKKAALGISFNLAVKDNDVQQKRVVVGTREVSDSKWWNPFSWGSTKTVRDYADEDYVDLERLWRDRVTRIETEFSRLVVNARQEIEAGKDRLVAQYVAFMTREFDTKLAELLSSINEKTTDRTARERAIAEAKELHSWIDNFKAKLDSTLAVQEGSHS